MAGAGWRDFIPGEVLTAANVQDYLQDQAVMVFASAAARTSAIASPTEGMVSYLKDSNLVEVYDGSAWKQLGATTGGVLQVVQASTTTTTTTSSTSFVDTGLTASITPTSSSSKILAMVTATVEASGVGLVGTIYRGATNIGDATHGTGRVSSGTNANFTFASTVLDSPATTSATTYTFYMRATSGTVYFNPVGARSTITLMEIAG